MEPSARDTLDFVVPRIYVALPNSGPADVTLAHENSPVEQSLVADLVIFYAFDFDTHYQILANRDLPRLGVSVEELHNRAVQNLRALKLEVRAHSGDRVIMLTAGGNYEATLLLLSEVWESVAAMTTGQLIVSVPARDLIFATGDSAKENLGELRRVTSKALEQAAKPLSRAFLQWDGQGWQKYKGFGA